MVLGGQKRRSFRNLTAADSIGQSSTFWLNLVERFFSELTQRQLRRLAVNSVAELEHAIDRYINARNRDPKPFTWTASAETILNKVPPRQ